MTISLTSILIAMTVVYGSFQAAGPPPRPNPIPQPPVAQQPAPPPAQPPAAPSVSSPADLKPFVALIRARLDGNRVDGSGVFVAFRNDRLYIATANHVLRTKTLTETIEATNIQVGLGWLPGELQPATMLTTFDETLDLAVVVVAGASRLAVPQVLRSPSMIEPRTLQTGEPVVPIGNALGQGLFIPQQRHLVGQVDAQRIRSEGEFSAGQSGGALATADGGIVGLVIEKDGLFAKSLRIDVIKSQFADWSIPFDLTIKPRASAAASGPGSLDQQRQEATALGGRWMAAMISGNFDSIADTVGAPFYFDQQILTTPAEVMGRFNSPRMSRRSDQPSIRQIKAMTVAETRTSGLDLSRDRIVSALGVTDTDWFVTVIVGVLGRSPEDGTVFVMRPVNGVLKVIGFWN